ncbi:MAG: hypothetical protein WB783_13385 [Arenicellales bacterium]
MSFGQHHLTPAIAEYQNAQPGVEVELTFNDRFVDIVKVTARMDNGETSCASTSHDTR